MSYTIIVTGKPGVGKTSLIRYLAGVDFEPTHITYVEPVDCTINVETSHGSLSFRFLEVPEIPQGLECHGIICAFDMTSNFLPSWTGLSQNPPVFYVGTKKDLLEEEIVAFYAQTSSLFRIGGRDLLSNMITRLTRTFGVKLISH